MTDTTRLHPGAEAPDFKAYDHTGTAVALSDHEGTGLVMYFYPRAFTPGCTTQACDFRDNYEAFARAGYRIFGVSPDEPSRLADFIAEHDLPFAMLSDADHSVSKAYGAWGVKKNYGREYEGMIRSTVVIDPAGKVEHAWYNVRARGHVARVAATLT
jgi:peroxiredoxin Q/BCP